MLNSSQFIKRLEMLMNHEELSASAFADRIDIGRSSISHILSGRNNPSLDFVLKVTEAFEDLDINWLLYGKGKYPREDESSHGHITKRKRQEVEKKGLVDKQPLLFEENIDTSSVQSESNLNSEASIPSRNAQIDRIVVFYSDGTFETYSQK